MPESLTEEMVKRHGERYRRMVISAMSWLSKEEPKWGLRQPINRRTFMAELIRNARKGESLKPLR